jgi:succinyl-diaminopimelate desuccinylase
MMGSMESAIHHRSTISGQDGLARRLAERTLALIDIPSVSHEESELLDHLASSIPADGPWRVPHEDESALFFTTARTERPFVVLAGHVDTVPPQGNLPGSIEGDVILGRGASDMKGALAVMMEVADWISDDPNATDLDVGLLFFGREELPITESALLPLFERSHLAREADLAIVMEPTSNEIHVGCLGNLNARVTYHGRSAHSARPWLGSNAIHAAIGSLQELAAMEPHDVEIEGLTFREVVNVTSVEGGVAANVVPDEVSCFVNARYAPSRDPQDAVAWLHEALGGEHVEIEILGNAPPGPVSVRNRLVERLRSAGRLQVGPKQAWTPVAEFAAAGVDAVNFGPGDPTFAHRRDERVEVAALVRSFEVLKSFLRGDESTAGAA